MALKTYLAIDFHLVVSDEGEVDHAEATYNAKIEHSISLLRIRTLINGKHKNKLEKIIVIR